MSKELNVEVISVTTIEGEPIIKSGKILVGKDNSILNRSPLGFELAEWHKSYRETLGNDAFTTWDLRAPHNEFIIVAGNATSGMIFK